MTIAEAQSEFLKSGGFRGGIDRPSEGKLSAIEQELSNYITAFLNKASDNLNKTNSITTGDLDRSLSFEVIPTSTGYLVNFKALDYFRFVDKGVRGAGSSRKNNTSPYTYRDKMPPIEPIEKWIIRNRLTATARGLGGRSVTSRTKPYKTKTRESKAIDPNKGRRDLAYIIAKSIKRDGLYETGFWSDAFDETFKDFGAKMSAALGKAITVNLEQMKEDLANFKGRGAGRGTLITTR